MTATLILGVLNALTFGIVLYIASNIPRLAIMDFDPVSPGPLVTTKAAPKAKKSPAKSKAKPKKKA